MVLFFNLGISLTRRNMGDSNPQSRGRPIPTLSTPRPTPCVVVSHSCSGLWGLPSRLEASSFRFY